LQNKLGEKQLFDKVKDQLDLQIPKRLAWDGTIQNRTLDEAINLFGQNQNDFGFDSEKDKKSIHEKYQ
jgi:hypothetical protein